MNDIHSSGALHINTTPPSTNTLPIPIQDILPDLQRPMKTRLVHHGTNLQPPLLFLLPIIKHLPDAHGYIFLNQHAPPSARLTHTAFPPPDLPLIILAAPPHEEPTVPLKPAADVIRVVDPAGGFPFLDALPARYFEFVDLGVVDGRSEVIVHVEPGGPGGWELQVVVGDGDAESFGVEGSEIGAAEAAFAEHFFGRFVGGEVWVGWEMES